MILDNYKTIIFDCDGVVLNSNSIKTNAFYKLSKPFGDASAKTLIDYHKNNGGISRYKKFDYFVRNIISNQLDKRNEEEVKKLIKKLCDEYGEIVIESLSNAEVAIGLKDLRQKTKNSDWIIVSGGDQKELRLVFEKKNISKYFNKGIFGSPKSKYEIIEKCLYKKIIDRPAIFIGDSKLDYKVANYFGIDFVFLSDWSEFENLNSYAKLKGINVYKKLINLLD